METGNSDSLEGFDPTALEMLPKYYRFGNNDRFRVFYSDDGQIHYDKFTVVDPDFCSVATIRDSESGQYLYEQCVLVLKDGEDLCAISPARLESNVPGYLYYYMSSMEAYGFYEAKLTGGYGEVIGVELLGEKDVIEGINAEI